MIKQQSLVNNSQLQQLGASEQVDILQPYNLQISDLTGLSSDKNFRKQCKEREIILISRNIVKINKRNREQERLLLITNEALYNILGKNIKRKIRLELIYGVTVSKKSTEFVIHIPDEYDYRFNSLKQPEIRDLLLQYLTVAMVLKKVGQGLRFFFVEQEDLDQYTLQEEASNKSLLQNIPKMIPIILNNANFQLNFINRTYCTSPTNILFVRNKSALRIRLVEDFSKQLGLMQGSLCKTFLVFQKSGQQQLTFVLKTIDKSIFDIDMDLLDVLLSSYEVHPFIEQLEIVMQSQAKIYLFFQFKKGGDLYQHIRINGPFQEEQAKFIIAQVACALSSLHEQGIVYGDLKPENVLLDELGNASLTDFGYGKLRIHRLFRKMGFLNFTPEYCPPEYLKSNELTRMSDWYQLGGMLYEMIVGIPLFYHQSSPEVTIELSLSEQLHLPRDMILSFPCINFMAELLNPDSSKRLGFKQDFTEIQSHEWLRTINFNALMNKKIDPPYKPKDVDNQSINPNYFTMDQLSEEERQW